jgi:hypothetical protein
VFGSKKRKFEKATNKFLTGSGLLKAAVANDKDAMTAMVMGQTADDEGIWYALSTFIMVAHKHPTVIERIDEIRPQMPDKAQLAFITASEAARAGNPKAFQGGNVVGQGLLLAYLSGAIAEEPEALADAMLMLQEGVM